MTNLPKYSGWLTLLLPSAENPEPMAWASVLVTSVLRKDTAICEGCGRAMEDALDVPFYDQVCVLGDGNTEVVYCEECLAQTADKQGDSPSWPYIFFNPAPSA